MGEWFEMCVTKKKKWIFVFLRKCRTKASRVLMNKSALRHFKQTLTITSFSRFPTTKSELATKLETNIISMVTIDKELFQKLWYHCSGKVVLARGEIS